MKLLDLKSLAEQTSLSIYTLRKYIKKNDMPCYVVGKKYLVDPEEFKNWFERFKKGYNLENLNPEKLFEDSLQGLDFKT